MTAKEFYFKKVFCTVKTYSKTGIPNLHEEMLRLNATNEVLAHKAGVSRNTVARLRSGIKVQHHIAACVTEALYKFNYKYAPKGRPRNG